MINRLRGRSILVIEHEPVVAQQLLEHFTRAGARVLSAADMRDALHLAEHPALSAAVVNLKIGDQRTTAVCRRLESLGIPFMFYTRHGSAEVVRQWPRAPVVAKPAETRVVLRTAAGLLN